MPQFTENQRASLMAQLQRDYEVLVSDGKSSQEIYTHLLSNVNYSLNYEQSALQQLDENERVRVYHALNNFYSACPQYYVMDEEQKRNFFIVDLNLVPEVDSHSRNCYCPTNETLFTWLVLDAALLLSSSPGYGCCSGYSPNSSDGEGWAIIILVILAALTIASVFVAMYYLFSQFLDSMERFWHNEGWMQAAISMLVTAATGCAAGLLTWYLLAAPLAALAITAGISNPIGIIIFATIALSIIGAGVGCFITNKVQNYALKKANPGAIDPYDVHRFKLTDRERINLIAQDLDPDKVLDAMIAIRRQMGGVPSLLNRVFTSDGRKKQVLLEQIRQLRSGNVQNGEIEINVSGSQIDAYKLRFDLKLASPVAGIDLRKH